MRPGLIDLMHSIAINAKKKRIKTELIDYELHFMALSSWKKINAHIIFHVISDALKEQPYVLKSLPINDTSKIVSFDVEIGKIIIEISVSKHTFRKLVLLKFIEQDKEGKPKLSREI